MLSELSLISTSVNTESGMALFPYLCMKTGKQQEPFSSHFSFSKIHENTLEDDKPLSRNEIDVMPQRRVVFGQLLRRRICPGSCRLGWICIRARGSPRQQAENQQHCSGGAAPGITWKTRVNTRETLSGDTNPNVQSLAAKHSASDFTSNNEQKYQHHHVTLEISVFSSLTKPRLSDSRHCLCFIVSVWWGGRENLSTFRALWRNIYWLVCHVHGRADSEISRVIKLYYYLCGVRAVMFIMWLSGRAVCLLAEPSFRFVADASLADSENLISSESPQKLQNSHSVMQ